MTSYGASGAMPHMRKTRRDKYDNKPHVGLRISTTSNQLLPVLGIGKLHVAFRQENPPSLNMKESCKSFS